MTRAAASPTPVPARITMALDAAGLYGPAVDAACGAAEPDVDRWEDPDDPLLPTPEQVARLADLTGMSMSFFYRPMPPDQFTGGYICFRSGPRPRCTLLQPEPPPPATAYQPALFPDPPRKEDRRPDARTNRPRRPR